MLASAQTAGSPKIYYINLEHRDDRRSEFAGEMAKLKMVAGSAMPQIIRVPAILHEVGAIGCGMSHCKALQKFLNTEDETAIIMEDDFTFADKMIPMFVEYLNQKTIPCEGDVLLLAANLRQQMPERTEFIRVLSSFTTSGYWVNRRVASELVKIWDYCSVMHSVSAKKPNPEYCIDVAWWQIMMERKFIAITPLLGQIGYQRPGYSDIEKRSVAYGV